MSESTPASVSWNPVIQAVLVAAFVFAAFCITAVLMISTPWNFIWLLGPSILVGIAFNKSMLHKALMVFCLLIVSAISVAAAIWLIGARP